jgi:outer membrane cobalamin receptor
MMRRHLRSWIVFCSSVCAFSIPAAAEEEKEDESKDEAAYQTVVTGKRIEEDPLLSSRSVSLVDEKALDEASPRTVPEALWDSPGVFVQETNYGGGSPILRGMIGPQLLLMVDGVRLSNSTYRTGPVQYLNLVDPLSISQIEILRGPGSILYGSDAMGGVIQVFPLEPPDFRLRKGFNGGGSLLFRYASANRGKTGHGHFNTGISGFGAMGGLTIKGFDNLMGGRGVGEQLYSAYDHWSAIGSTTYRFSKGFFSDWHLKVGYLFSQIEDAGRTDKLYDKHSLQVYDNTDHLVYGRLHMMFQPIKTSADLTISFQHFFERKDTVTVGQDLRPGSPVRHEGARQSPSLPVRLHVVPRFC